ncbi:MAG: histidine phosphatase family protein [Hasllibacter sp.]
MPFEHELLVLRHGQTVWNAQRRFQGRLNSPLTPVGRAQAARQRTILEALDLTGFRAVCSPLGRAVETAGIAVAPLVAEVRTDDRIAEIDVGDWSGRLRAEVPAGLEGAAGDEGLALYAGAPGGEGAARLRARCAAFLADLDGPAVLVTHGIAGRMLRAVALGLGDDELDGLPGGQGVVQRVRGGAQETLT